MYKFHAGRGLPPHRQPTAERDGPSHYLLRHRMMQFPGGDVRFPNHICMDS